MTNWPTILLISILFFGPRYSFGDLSHSGNNVEQVTFKVVTNPDGLISSLETTTHHQNQEHGNKTELPLTEDKQDKKEEGTPTGLQIIIIAGGLVLTCIFLFIVWSHCSKKGRGSSDLPRATVSLYAEDYESRVP